MSKYIRTSHMSCNCLCIYFVHAKNSPCVSLSSFLHARLYGPREQVCCVACRPVDPSVWFGCVTSRLKRSQRDWGRRPVSRRQAEPDGARSAAASSAPPPSPEGHTRRVEQHVSLPPATAHRGALRVHDPRGLVAWPPSIKGGGAAGQLVGLAGRLGGG